TRGPSSSLWRDNVLKRWMPGIPSHTELVRVAKKTPPIKASPTRIKTNGFFFENLPCATGGHQAKSETSATAATKSPRILPLVWVMNKPTTNHAPPTPRSHRSPDPFLL